MKLWMIAVLVVAALGVAFMFMQFRSQSAVGMGSRISPQQYQTEYVQAKAPHVLVDVRTAEEFASGHIPGAVNIDVQHLQLRMREIPRDQPVVLYCRSGNRSATAARILKAEGYEDVYDLGGIIEWRAQGLPVR
jgi:rhodanese-related sulfurtransferase